MHSAFICIACGSPVCLTSVVLWIQSIQLGGAGRCGQRLRAFSTVRSYKPTSNKRTGFSLMQPRSRDLLCVAFAECLAHSAHQLRSPSPPRFTHTCRPLVVVFTCSRWLLRDWPLLFASGVVATVLGAGEERAGLLYVHTCWLFSSCSRCQSIHAFLLYCLVDLV